MKNLRILIWMLLFLVGWNTSAWAADDDLPQTSTKEAPQYYKIKNTRASKYAKYTGDAAQMALVSAANSTVMECLFYFVEVQEEGLADGVKAVKIVNAAAPDKFCAAPNSFTNEGITWYLKANVYTGTPSVAINSSATVWDNNNYGWNDAGGNGTTIAYWASTDQGSAWIFELAGASDLLPYQKNSAKLEVASAPGVFFSEESKTTASSDIEAANSDEEIQTVLNTFFAQANGCYTFQNNSTSLYLNVNSSNNLNRQEANDAACIFRLTHVENGGNKYTLYNTSTKRYARNAYQGHYKPIGTTDGHTDGEIIGQFQLAATTVGDDVMALINTNAQGEVSTGRALYDDTDNSRIVVWGDQTTDRSQWRIANVEPVTITYEYKIGTDQVATQSISCMPGDEYPEPSSTLPAYYTAGSKPSGTVTGNESCPINLTWTGPFEFTTITNGQFAEDTKWYAMKNNGSNYVYFDNDAAAKSSFSNSINTEKTDCYQWCFVRKEGSTDFYIYNKQAGPATALREQLSDDTGYQTNHNQGFCVVKTDETNDMPLTLVANGAGYALRLASAEVAGKTCLLGNHTSSKLSIWGRAGEESVENNQSRFTFEPMLETPVTEGQYYSIHSLHADGSTTYVSSNGNGLQIAGSAPTSEEGVWIACEVSATTMGTFALQNAAHSDVYLGYCNTSKKTWSTVGGTADNTYSLAGDASNFMCFDKTGSSVANTDHINQKKNDFGNYSSDFVFTPVTMSRYTVEVSGLPASLSGGAIYRDNSYANSAVITALALTPDRVEAVAVTGYAGTASVVGNKVLVAYECESFTLDTSKQYFLKQKASGKYVSLDVSIDANAKLSDTGYALAFTRNEDGSFLIESAASPGVFLGASSWNAIASGTAASWTITETDNGLQFYQGTAAFTGNLGSDNTDTDSPLYDNKGNNHNNSFFELEELTVTYIYKYGETEWFRETKPARIGEDYPELKSPGSNVKYTTMPYGKVSGKEEFDVQCAFRTELDFPLSTDPANPLWFYTTIHGSTRYFWKYDSSTGRVKTTETTFANAKDQDSYLWAIMGNPIGGYSLINKAATGKVLTSPSPEEDGNSNGGNTFPVLSDETAIPDGHAAKWSVTNYNHGWRITRENESYYLNRRGDDLAFWTTGCDDGSRVGFFPQSESISLATLATSNKTYRLVNRTTGTALTATDEGMDAKTGITAANANQELWTLTGSADNGYKLQNVQTGTYLTTSGTLTNEGSTIYISTGSKEGYYHLSSAKAVSNTPAIFLAATGSNAKPALWSSLSQSSDWQLEEVTAAPSSQYVSTLTSGKYYRIQNHQESDRFITASDGLLYAYPKSDTGYDQLWKATANGSNWTFQNLLTQTYIQETRNSNPNAYTVGNTQGSLIVTKQGTNASNSHDYFLIAPASASGQYFNDSKSNQGYRIVQWSDTNDQSNWWYFEEVELSEEQLQEADAYRQEWNIKNDIINQAATYATQIQNFFDDPACTQLKETYRGMSDEALKTAMEAFPDDLQQMAVNVKNDQWVADATMNHYVKDFRIHAYEAYSDAAVWQNETQVGPFALLTNPTGITVMRGDIIYLMVSDDAPADATLKLGISTDTNRDPAQTAELHQGLNIIKSNTEGECFVMYTVTNKDRYVVSATDKNGVFHEGEFAPITVHIEGGTANGCWDMHRGHNNNDWLYLSANMLEDKFLHIKAENTILHVLSDGMRGADNMEKMCRIFDFIFMTQERLIGHDGQWDGRYTPVMCARESYGGNPNWGGGSANLPGLSNTRYSSLLNSEDWGIKHEEAHGHQYPINLAATTESSNNGLVQMLNFEFGRKTSREWGVQALIDFKNNGWGWVDILRGGEGTSRDNRFEYYEHSLWLQNKLFYQLYLYFHVQGHMPDFWPRVSDWLRAHGGLKKYGNNVSNANLVPTPTLYNEDYLLLAEACTRVSETDLYEFFDTYGFFANYEDVKVGNDFEGFRKWDNAEQGIRYVGDYGHYFLKMPMRDNAEDQAYLTNLKNLMKSQPKKAPNIMFENDRLDHQGAWVITEDKFCAQLEPSLIGQPVGVYDRLETGDFGMFYDFNGKNEANDIDYQLQDFEDTHYVTIQGDGLVGIKIYDAEGNLIRIYNTRTFEVDDEVAEALRDGSNTLVVALADDTNLPITYADTKYQMTVYHGNADDTKVYNTAAKTIDQDIPYLTQEGVTTAEDGTITDIPVFKDNAMAVVNVPYSNSLPRTLLDLNNTIIGTEETGYTAPHLVLTDKKDYYAPVENFTTEHISYTRTNTTGYNTVCLPFAISATTFGEKAKVYQLTGVENMNHVSSLTFTEIEGLTTIPAGTPCLVENEENDWTVGIEGTWFATGLSGSSEGLPADDDTMPVIQGAFQRETLGEGYYKLNNDGTKFVRTTAASTITPFRFYLNIKDVEGNNISEVREFGLNATDNETTTTSLDDLMANRNTHIEESYDLSGRRVVRISHPGIIIKGGKKFFRR